MADHYPKQQVGVADGTKTPADRADGREVNAKRRSILASKVTGTAWASGDRVFLGKKPQGYKLTDVKVCASASLGTSTLDVGDADTANKYVAGATMTTADVPTSIGPKASTLAADPGAAEDLWLTIGVAAIVAGTELTVNLEFTGL